MTDEMNRTPGAGPGPEAAPEAAAAPPSGEETRSAQAREWLAQLQQMIDRIAAEAGPVARDVAAKAAELAAVAGEKAGPFAKRAAEVTGDVGSRVAERSRRFADDIRHRAPEGGTPPAAAAGGGTPAEANPVPGEEPPA
jgi:gas vesicle protein